MTLSEFCCGLPVELIHEVFGVQVFQCQHRPGHPRVYRNVATGAVVREDQLSPGMADGRQALY